MEKIVPKNWTEAKLGDILKLKNGYAFKSSDYQSEGVPLIRISDIQKGKVTTKKAVRITESNVINDFKLEKNDVLLAMSGATTGKYGIYTENKLAIQNQRVGNLRPFAPELTSKKFIYYVLGVLKEDIEEKAYGAAQPNISSRLIEGLDILLPPFNEQTRIVTKLDKLFSNLDKLKARLAELIVLKSDFIKSCLINPITNEYYSRKRIGEYLEEGTARIGEEWENCRRIGVSSAKGIIDLSTGRKKTFEKYKVVQPGDFIYNTMRVNIGSIAIYEGKEIAVTSPDYVVFRVNNTLSSQLLLGFLKSEQGLLEVGTNTKGSVRARLYFKSLSEIRMPVGIEIQDIAQRFLEKFNVSLMKISSTVVNDIPKLEKSILHKAFSGELVEQDPEDESAEILLERIKELKESISKKK